MCTSVQPFCNSKVGTGRCYGHTIPTCNRTNGFAANSGRCLCGASESSLTRRPAICDSAAADNNTTPSGLHCYSAGSICSNSSQFSVYKAITEGQCKDDPSTGYSWITDSITCINGAKYILRYQNTDARIFDQTRLYTSKFQDFPRGCVRHQHDDVKLEFSYVLNTYENASRECGKRKACVCIAKLPPCRHSSGRHANDAACICGETMCTPSHVCVDGDGGSNNRVFYCDSSKSLCSPNVMRSCEFTDGLKSNAETCNCGSSVCSAEPPPTGLFCYESGSKCSFSQNFTAGLPRLLDPLSRCDEGLQIGFRVIRDEAACRAALLKLDFLISDGNFVIPRVRSSPTRISRWKVRDNSPWLRLRSYFHGGFILFL